MPQAIEVRKVPILNVSDASGLAQLIDDGVLDADRVIAGLRPRFRQCYNTGLQSDPGMSGKVVIAAKVGPNGEVQSANVASNSGLSDSVASCIARAVRGATFAAPGGGVSTLNIPVTFVQQK